MKIKSINEIPERATIRQEFTKCSNPRCKKTHGPYLYAYWKEKGHLNKVYIGKSMDKLRFRLDLERYSEVLELFSSSELRKMHEMSQFSAQFDDTFTKKYLKMAEDEKCQVSWAYRRFHRRLSDICEELARVGLEATESNIRSYLTHELGN